MRTTNRFRGSITAAVMAAVLAALCQIPTSAQPTGTGIGAGAVLIDDSPYILTAYTRDGCPPCDKFKSDLCAGLLSRWAFIVVKHTRGPNGDLPLDTYPRFQWRRKVDGSTWVLEGYHGPTGTAEALAKTETMPRATKP